MTAGGIRKYLCVTAVSLILAFLPSVTYAKGWETLKTERTDTKQVAKEHDLEIRSAKGVIIVSTNKPVQIKIFTILGRLVNNEQLQPGTSQFILPAHGVYVVQTGDITCKIAV